MGKQKFHHLKIRMAIIIILSLASFPFFLDEYSKFLGRVNYF